jgi:hypothetical protein
MNFAKVQLMEKDMRLAVEAARQVEAKLVLGEAAVGAYSAAASDPNYRDKDSRVVYKWYVNIRRSWQPDSRVITHTRLGGVDPR